MTSDSTRARSVIVFVGDAPELDALDDLVREFLDRKRVEVESSRASTFEPDALFEKAADDPTVRVFVRVDATRARLYFRGPGGERYLLRTIALPSGLDDVGRELIGQVVESSVDTLLTTSSGLSREQASAEVAREAPVEKTTPKTPEKTEPAAKPSLPSEPKSSSLAFSLAVRYSLESFGPDFELGHGPGVELGLGTRRGLRLRGRLSADRFFDQALQTTELDATVQQTSFRGALDLGVPVTTHGVMGFGIGAGIEVTRIDPGAPRSETVTPSDPQSDVAPGLRMELRYEHALGSVVLGVLGFTDISLVRTHYDLVETGGTERVGVPWLVRPGGALVLGTSY